MIDSRQVVWLVGCHFERVIRFLVFKREKEKPSHKYQYLNTRQVFKFLHYSMTDIYIYTVVLFHEYRKPSQLPIRSIFITLKNHQVWPCVGVAHVH